ncbi:4-oxalocrotonate tautomerase DmpI [Methanosphaera sp. BMS]|uniref:4-oxalocrotonate tautomerase DmpI n=1 Tax=Methanosphaera sp. BMS TaxID=1789762 RepID=UPI000DC1D080|nr:4-oxalocrotonate tautomerase DmpI [Methanosphaera sp. BMS]AWX32745.1 4-oxalocrotonate tautomerase [Methanosphaera sp. BMS]MBQ6220716.1 2-hydroxymuconate tautomerase family protein [Methanosphaera sp.]MBR3213673.1 2-hydroxymuconate tautomerase family protein [Methanosphaera sp.]
MPVITISGPENVSKEAKKEIIEKTSKIVSEAYGLPIQTITVIIEETNSDNVGVAGEQLSERLNK